MTEEFKDLLLEYLTNNLDENTGSNVPIFTDKESVASTVYTQLSAVMTYGFIEKGILKCKDGTGQYNGRTLIYGYRYTDNNLTFNDALGFLALLDEKYELLELITEYNTGTQCQKFITLNTDNDGTIYGIDTQSTNDTGRFIMINNVSVKNEIEEHYTLKLRKSYTITPMHYRAVFCTGVNKDPNSARYFIEGTSAVDCFEFTIRVGETNLWLEYDVQYNVSQYTARTLGFREYWDSEGKITAYGLGLTSEINNVESYKIYGGVSDDNENIVLNEIFDVKADMFSDYDPNDITVIDSSLGGIYVRRLFSASIYMINKDEFYLTIPVVYDDGNDYHTLIRTSYYKNGTITTLYTHTIEWTEQYASYNSVMTEMKNINGNLFVMYYVGTGSNINPSYTIYAGIIIDEDTSSTVNMGSISTTYVQRFFIVDITNVYNLYTVNVMGRLFDGEYLNYSYLVYNKTNYNGEPYSDTNALVPNQVLLYDTNDRLLFARNLYDKIIYNNITESIVEIPNSMLNDIVIGKQDLLGETNYILDTNEDDIEKNIYETLYINFFNTLKMINKNDPNNPILNPDGATRINTSISETNDYNNAKIGKVRINYEDNTQVVKDITSSTITGGICDIQFTITPIKEMTSIDIISSDTNTVYQRIIDVSPYKIGNTYTISQKCHVE